MNRRERESPFMDCGFFALVFKCKRGFSLSIWGSSILEMYLSKMHFLLLTRKILLCKSKHIPALFSSKETAKNFFPFALSPIRSFLSSIARRVLSFLDGKANLYSINLGYLLTKIHVDRNSLGKSLLLWKRSYRKLTSYLLQNTCTNEIWNFFSKNSNPTFTEIFIQARLQIYLMHQYN